MKGIVTMRCKKGKNLIWRKGLKMQEQLFCKACGKVVSTDVPYFKYDASKCAGCTKSLTDERIIALTRKHERIETSKKQRDKSPMGYGSYLNLN